MDVYIYFDNSNIFIEAKRLAEERNGLSHCARQAVRLHFDNLLALASAGRTVKHAVAAGSVPPELRNLWARLQRSGVECKVFECGDGGEQNVPDVFLQLAMLRDAFKNPPSVAVLLTGDGAGHFHEEGFLSTLKDLKSAKWHIEVLSWAHCVNKYLFEWVKENIIFIPLDDYYESITELYSVADDVEEQSSICQVKPLHWSRQNSSLSSHNKPRPEYVLVAPGCTCTYHR